MLHTTPTKTNSFDELITGNTYPQPKTLEVITPQGYTEPVGLVEMDNGRDYWFMGQKNRGFVKLEDIQDEKITSVKTDISAKRAELERLVKKKN